MSTSIILSPAELSYLYTSLSLSRSTYHNNPIGPIRPDSRTPTQFRPLIAETDILPACFGSARVIVGGGEGGECIVGIKAEVEKTEGISITAERTIENWKSWIEINVDTQGLRDDDALNVVLAAIVGEALWSSETNRALISSLRINSRFHWKLYIDVLLIIPPAVAPLSSHPLTLTSLSTYLALVTTSLPLQTSEGNEDPIFSDDWDQAIPLYKDPHKKPPICLLAMSVGDNVFVDPSREELSVAEGVWCISVDCSILPYPKTKTSEGDEKKMKRKVKIVGIRTLESFSSSTIPIPDTTGFAGGEEGGKGDNATTGVTGIPPGVVGGRGGTSIQTLKKVVKTVGTVAEEVWEALEGVVERDRR